MKPLAKAQTNDLTRGGLFSVAWSRDGATIVAGGTAQGQFNGGSREFLRRFDETGHRQGADIAASNNGIMDIQPCGEGFAFSTYEPSFGLLSGQGNVTVLRSQGTVEMIGKLGGAFSASADVSSVRFGLGFGGHRPVVFDLAGSLTESPSLPSGYFPVKVDGLPVTDWLVTAEPKFNGVKVSLGNGATSFAMAIRPDASGFVIGTQPAVLAYDAKGERRWRHVAPRQRVASIFQATARSFWPPAGMGRSAGCAGATAGNCSPFSLSP